MHAKRGYIVLCVTLIVQHIFGFEYHLQDICFMINNDTFISGGIFIFHLDVYYIPPWRYQNVAGFFMKWLYLDFLLHEISPHSFTSEVCRYMYIIQLVCQILAIPKIVVSYTDICRVVSHVYYMFHFLFASNTLFSSLFN